MERRNGFSLVRSRRSTAHMPVFMVSLAALLVAWTVVAWSAEADVTDVKATQTAANNWRFDVTVAHADEGWDHYADLWEVVAPDGTVLGSRVLAHPHVNEQPFTRSLSGVAIAEEIGTVTVRARDSVHGFGGAEMTVDLDALR